MSEHVTFHPAFAVAARDGLGRDQARSWETARRDARLLVPVDVQALVVEPDDPLDHADVAVQLLTAVDSPRTSVPFTDIEAGDARARVPGVHLHWSLPDGLTRTRGHDADGNPRWRALPDRWLVARMLNELPYPMRYWIVESEHAAAFDLSGWPGTPLQPARTPDLPADKLTAVVGGDPAWAAVYDNVACRFAFHDDLSGVPSRLARALTYVVVGWYSTPGLDPLDSAEQEDGFDAVLRALGWAVDPERLSAVQAEAEEGVRATARLGLGALPHAVRARPDLAELSPDGAALVEQSRPWWPRQSLYHGVVYGVRRQTAAPDPRPEPDAVDVCVGATSVEAAGRLIATRSGDDVAEVQHAAFAYGVTDALSDPDGVTRIDEEFHARAFESRPGGQRAERVLVGDPFEDVRAPEFPTPASDQVLADADGSVQFAFTTGASRVADLLVLRTRPDRVAAPPDPRRLEERSVPLPRWYVPQDPVVLLSGLGRSLRHGYDGRFSADERLRCRLSGDTVSRLAGVIDGRVLVEDEIGHGAVPAEVQDLVIEAAVENPFLDISEQVAGRLGLPYRSIHVALTAESRLFLWSLARPADAARLHSHSLKDGVGSSPAGITIWRQPWVPLYLEWELDLELDDRLEGWHLDELDYEPDGPVPSASAVQTTVSGRSLLTSASGRALADAITAFCDGEDRLDLEGAGELEEHAEAQLRTLAGEAARTDLLSGGLDGLRERLLGHNSEVERADSTGELQSPPPGPDALLLRAGIARLQRLRVVDTFGRRLPLVDNRKPTPQVGRGLRDDTRPDVLLVRPRLHPPARLLLRLLDAGDDTAEAVVDQSRTNPPSPVAGWLLADHVDGAVEFFDPAGAPLGQLVTDPLSGAVVWEGPPGHRGRLGATPVDEGAGSVLRHLTALARGVLAEDASERAGSGVARSDSPLTALLRVVDTTAETIAPSGMTGTEHVAQLSGRPIAVVRAALRLEVQPEVPHPLLADADRAARAEAWRRLTARAFPVRLGALTRLNDGLLGYFVDDDYTTLWPVHQAVLASAADSGPRRGWLRSLDDAGPAAAPLDSPFLSQSAAVPLRPGRTVHLTLLMDPSASVHATSGLLPRKSLALVRDWTAPALSRITPSFRVGPVLVDPGTVRMPHAQGLGSRLEWSRRDSETQWRHDPIVAATQQAFLHDAPAVLQEGYIRVELAERPHGTPR